jgi:hypothetical protein
MDKFLNEKQTSEMTAIAVSTLRNDRHLKRGLPYSKFGNTVRYSLKDIIRFMDSHKVEVDEKPRR